MFFTGSRPIIFDKVATQGDLTKRPKKDPLSAIKKQQQNGEDSDEIDKRSKVKITDDMFLAAKLMDKGVSHIDKLDMSVVKRAKSLQKPPGNCQVTIIDILTGETKVAGATRPLAKDACRFDFNSETLF